MSNRPLALRIGWWPASLRSRTARRRCPSVNPPSWTTPAPSGPLGFRTSSIARTTPGSSVASFGRRIPAIPHTRGVPPGRRHGAGRFGRTERPCAGSRAARLLEYVRRRDPSRFRRIIRKCGGFSRVRLSYLSWVVGGALAEAVTSDRGLVERILAGQEDAFDE